MYVRYIINSYNLNVKGLLNYRNDWKRIIWCSKKSASSQRFKGSRRQRNELWTNGK